MPTFKNRIGLRYGRLLVISHAGKSNDNRNKHLWLCKCDCGNEKIVSSCNLSSGKSKSCGCLVREFLKRKGNQWGLYEDRKMAMFKVQYAHLKRRHTKFGYRDELMPIDRFIELSNSKCNYCGLEHSKLIEDRLNETKTLKRMSEEVLEINGIDRLDSNKGYTIENSVPCCKFCNFAKHTMSFTDFMAWIKKVYEYSFK